ncbi:hypothetical protein ACIRF8_35420 [Streptomyces sp. NPDC102406]|uniref:hypothetical protein n=1 Tax=Streptomyces sp. NPDC102406 TaxID=3366171 RepID=UPI00381989E4
MTGRTASRPGLHRALALFLLAPLIGEYLLGNTPLTNPLALFLFAPLYGGGALLIREAARRTGRTWPTIILLAAAYALWEEGPVDMMLFNTHYGGFDLGAAYAGTYLSGLGTSLQMLQDVLSMHVVWSICVPIALIESFDGVSVPRPWLSRRAFTLVAAVFVLGSALLCAFQIAGTGFVASPAELTWSAVVIVALGVGAFHVGHRPAPEGGPSAPRPHTVALAAFTVTSLYWARDWLPESVPGWLLCALWVVGVAGSAAVCAHWARGHNWGPRHRLALAGGALLTYVWAGFVQGRGVGTPLPLALTGSALLGAGSLWLLRHAWHNAGEPHRQQVAEMAPGD